MSYLKEAREKLEREAKAGSYGKYGEAMKPAVLEALKDFCNQSESFSEKVIKGGSFEECMKAVSKGVKGGSISDFSAFSLAVSYYWPAAEIRFVMEIREKGTQPAAEEKKKPQAEILSLADFM